MAKTTAKSASKAPKCQKSASRPKNVAASTHVVREVTIPEDYEPIGMWGYFGYQFLFSIPLVGWILCISFALMAHNHNLRNFARSQFCWLIIYIVIFCVLAACGILQSVVDSIM